MRLRSIGSMRSLEPGFTANPTAVVVAERWQLSPRGGSG